MKENDPEVLDLGKQKDKVPTSWDVKTVHEQDLRVVGEA